MVGIVVFGALGTLIGIWTTDPAYGISASLIKRRVPQTVQTSETGQAFRPVDLNDATLLATLLASEPLDLAFKQAQNGVTSDRGRSLVEASQLEGTDIFFITYHSPVSSEDAVGFTKIWAEEINAYTRRLQQSEAHEVRLILQKEVASLEKEAAETNLEILNFSKEKNYLGGESQVAATLGKLSQIELQLEAARTTASAKEQQLKNLTEQIQKQSPIDQQLKTATEELANLRATYTDANPLVQAKLQSLEYLHEQITKLGDQGTSNIDSFTGTPLGNQLYLSILSLRNELLEASTQIQSLEKLQQATSARLQEFPGILGAYQTLQKKRDSTLEGLSLMSNRLKEAEIFASGAPGYWQVFQAPDPRSVIPSSMVKKPALFGILSGFAGAAVAGLLTLLFTHRTSRRSILECCAATGAPLICHIPISYEEDARAAIEQFWITYLSTRLYSPGRVLFWTPALDPAEERRFWSLLSSVAQDDAGKQLIVRDLSPDSLWSATPAPDTVKWIAADHPEITPSIVRAAALPHAEVRAAFSHTIHWINVVAGQKKSLRRAIELRALTDAYLPPCEGTIGWIERPEGPIRRSADKISGFLARRFS